MTDKSKVLADTLAAHDFSLVRKRKHNIFRNPEGKTLVTSATPSDRRVTEKQLRDLRHLLNQTPAPANEASDATLSKQEKKRTGASHSANVFNFCGGIAPPSIRATPEATLIALGGHLRSRNSYAFKSEFVKEVMRIYRTQEQRRIEATESCVRDFAEIWRAAGKFFETGAALPIDTFERPIQYRVFLNNVTQAWEFLNQRGVPIYDDNLMEATLSRLQVEIRLSRKSEIAKRAALLKLLSRIANHLLRGESADEIRAFIAPHIQAIEDRFEFDFNFDFGEFIEEIAAQKIAETSR